MDVPSQFSLELLDAVKHHLDTGRFKEALELPKDNKYAAALKDNCWDLIPYLISKIEDHTIITWPALQVCCEKLLLVIAEKANAEEVLLEFLEQCEVSKNDARFIVLLKPLQMALKRVDNKRTRSIEWCLNTIQLYVTKLPPPEDYNLSGDEKLLMDSEENSRRIIKIYNELPTFYDHFLDKIVENKKSNIKDIMIAFLIDLMGKPLGCLHVECDSMPKSQTYLLLERLFKDLYSINNDLFIYLNYVQIKCNPPSRSSKEAVYENAPSDIFLLDEKLSPISLGVLYYLLLSEKFSAPRLPQVYSPLYICREILELVIILLKKEEWSLQYKGLKLARDIFRYIPEPAPSSLLSSNAYHTFVNAVCINAIYCPSELVRKEAVSLLKYYIYKFEDKGRFMIIRNLLSSLEHSGIKGYIVNIYKDLILETYDIDNRLNSYKDKYLQDIFQIICNLSHGAETDLVDNADYIISTLNLLRFLALKDITNKTGVWNYFKNIEDNFLHHLRNGIEISRAHYEVKLNILSREAHNVPNISVSIGNSVLDKLPVKNKKDVISSALNALHLIDCLLSRLQECICLGNKCQEHISRVKRESGVCKFNAKACIVFNRCLWNRIFSPSRLLSTNTEVNGSNTTQTNNDSKDSSKDDDTYVDDIKSKILSTSLKYVTDFGWSKEALGKGAEELGYSSTTHALFPHGAAHLVLFFSTSCNDKLMHQMEKTHVNDQNRIKFIEDSIISRIELLEPYKNSWSFALANVVSSKLAPKYGKTILSLSDDICYYAGDRSVDINWYTRRMGIATIYKASELYWLGSSDKVPNNLESTRKFTSGQLKCAEALHQIPHLVSAALITTRNMLSINWKR